LTAQYHFAPTQHVRPYVGAGINYTIFWNESASDSLQSAVGPTKVHLKDSVGWAAQAGVDVDITPRIFVNCDVKYIDIDTTARLDNATLGRQRVNVSLDPLVFGIGVGVRL
jgi:outer membrane protein